MHAPKEGDLTSVLESLVDGSADADTATERLYQAAYYELQRIARRFMRNERANHTLQATALVHEAYLKLVDQTRVHWQGRDHFLGVAACAMRQILVDHARRFQRDKRGGGWNRVTLDDDVGSTEALDFDILALHEALEKFAVEDPRAARIVELRVFGGLPSHEAARFLGISKRTADTDWRVAQMWLARELRA